MSPSDFGEENTTAFFPIKPLSASLSLAWQKQKPFVLLGIGVRVCVCVCVLYVHVSISSILLFNLCSSIVHCLIPLCVHATNIQSWLGTFWGSWSKYCHFFYPSRDLKHLIFFYFFFFVMLFHILLKFLNILVVFSAYLLLCQPLMWSHSQFCDTLN